MGPSHLALAQISHSSNQLICCCCNRDTLLSIAKHYETGETLPEEIYAKLVAAKNFRAGTFSLRQVP